MTTIPLEDQLLQIGKNLTSARERKGLSVRSAAARMGITHSYLSRLEAGKVMNPSTDFLLAAAGFYGLTFSMQVQRDPVAPTNAALSDDDRDMLEQIAKLLPKVTDPVDRQLALRVLEMSAARVTEPDGKTAAQRS